MPEAASRSLHRRAGPAFLLLASALLHAPLHGQIVTDDDRATMRREIPVASEALDKWLGLIEARAFEAAWDQSSQLFKRDQDRNTWITTLYRFRDAFSPVKRRQLLGATYTKALAPVSTAEAVSFQLVVYFVNETLGLETLVFMKEPDGEYRVASYTFNRGPVITTPAPLGY